MARALVHTPGPLLVWKMGDSENHTIGIILWKYCRNCTIEKLI